MAVVCPKPRRYGFSLDDHLRPFRHQTSIGASQAESELLDTILTKRRPQLSPANRSATIIIMTSSSSTVEKNVEKKGVDLMAFGPPFFCGSPPSRAPNPVVQDEQFHKEDVGLQPMSARKAGRFPAKFGHQPAMIRVEGFDSRDRRNCSVSALA